MMLKTMLAGLASLALGAGAAAAQEEGDTQDTHAEGQVTDFRFSFEGPFGRYDQAQLQRGLQVYTEVCSACHGLKFVAYRTLHDPGGPAMTEEQMRAYAAMFEVTDAETGEPRPATPSDHFAISTDPNAPDFLNVTGLTKRKPGVVYIVRDINLVSADKIRLHLGYDGPVKVWWNGKEVFAGTGTNPAIKDQSSVVVTPHDGANHLAIALDTNDGKAEGVFVRHERV